MFCAYDDENNIIAFHDSRSVVENYVNKIYLYHKIRLDVRKLKKYNYDKIKGLDDLYLVRYGETYVQSGYLIYLQISSNQIVEDNEFARDILYRLLETNRLDKKEEKTISKAITIMEDIVHEDGQYTPSLRDLQNLKTEYDPYFYNSGMY